MHRESTVTQNAADFHRVLECVVHPLGVKYGLIGSSKPNIAALIDTTTDRNLRLSPTRRRPQGRAGLDPSSLEPRCLQQAAIPNQI